MKIFKKFNSRIKIFTQHFWHCFGAKSWFSCPNLVTRNKFRHEFETNFDIFPKKFCGRSRIPRLPVKKIVFQQTFNCSRIKNFIIKKNFQIAEWTKRYGPLYGLQLGGSFNVLVTADPAIVRQVVVTNYAAFQSHLVKYYYCTHNINIGLLGAIEISIRESRKISVRDLENHDEISSRSKNKA